MAIAKNKGEQIPRTEDPVQVYADNYKGNTVDTKKTLLTSLRQYVSGMSMIVNYYSQILSETNIPRNYSLATIPAQQQYQLVKGLELKVSSELDTSPNEDNTFTVTGSSVIYAGIDPPNQYDVFVTDIGDGREGLFSVTSVKRQTMLAGAVYEIDYTLLFIMDQSFQDNLDLKTVRTFNFVKDFLTLGHNPLITDSDLVNYKEAFKTLRDLSSSLFTRYFSKKYQTFLVPGQDEVTYDHFYNNAIINFAFFEEFTSLMKVRFYGVYDLNFDDQKSLWDSIFTLNFKLLNDGFKKAGLVSSTGWSRTPSLKSIYFSNIHYVVSPKENAYNVDDDNSFNDCLTASLDFKDSGYDNSGEPPMNSTIVNPAIKPVMIDDFYILSESFYTEDKDNMSVLEAQLHNAMMNETVNYTLVMGLASRWYEWPDLERFYYGPIICVLLAHLATTIGRYHVN